MIDWGALLADQCATASADNGAPADTAPSSMADEARRDTAATGDADNAGNSPGIDASKRHDDDRRYCVECGNLAESGRCLAALRREFVAGRNYEPIRDILLRCGSFIPLPNDIDQRHGRDRWPGL